MKAGKTLDDLLIEVERRANAKRDFVVGTDALEMTGDNALMVAGEYQLEPNEIAHDQIGAHCEIPAKYYDKMRAEAPALLASNVNHWFRKEPVKRMVRAIDTKARAFLSDRYRRLENEDLALAAIPALREAGVDVMSSEITDRRMYIKAVDPKVTRELQAKGGVFGDGAHNIVRVLAPAITISNSEVGSGALSVLAGVYDGFCSNLATFGERSARRYHVGKQADLGEDVYALLSQDTRDMTDKAFWAQIGDVVRAAFDRAKFDALCEKITATQEHKITGEPEKVVLLTTRKLGMTDAEGKVTLRHLLSGGDMSRFGLYNAITRASQDIESYDRATEFERLGAQVIELPDSEWKPILQAA